ncbi:MAG: aspartate aminotransferase family protein [Gemmatimonadaceae bacterium]|nr:aspartate aminotransferase family protein [Gemmatimonadaceae bacterium]
MTTYTPEALDALWMPFTANKAFKADPRLLVSAKDMHYRSADGREILDGAAGLWCVNAGHCRAPIADAIAEAARTLDFAPGFQMGHPGSFALANALKGILPTGIDHVFFSNSGSEAVDSALKIALAYHQSNGQPQRTRFVGRLRGYHGVGFGGISVGGIELNRKTFAAQLLPLTDHLPHTHDPAHNAFSRGQPAHGASLADALEQIITERGGETIAAVIVEPVAGSTGVLVPPVGYLERLRAICSAHGILLIFDEVITGLGRLGAPFAAQSFGVTPDMITLAKGVTNGAVPLGATAVQGWIYDTVVNASAKGIEFFHGYTYSGHPLAAAAGLATLSLYQSEGLFARAKALAPYWENAVHSLRSAPGVIDVRNVGLVAGIELASRADAIGARAYEVFIDCFKVQNALIRVTSDTIALSPPLIISEAQVDELVAKVRRAIERVPA